MSFLRRHAVAIFFVVTLLVQGATVWAEAAGRAPALLIRARLYLPAVFALALTFLLDGGAGLAKLGRSLVKFRVAPGWYAFALLYAPVVSVAPVFAFKLLGLTDQVEVDTTMLTQSGLLFLKLVVTIAVVEEISWVSFGIWRLYGRFTFFVASALGGACWGLWYVPLNVAGIQVAGQFPNIAMVFNFMAIGAVCGWLYERTGSAILVALMQVIVNYASLTFPVLPHPGKVGMYHAFIGLKAVFAVWLFWRFGPRPLLRAPAATQPAPTAVAASG